MGTSLGLQLDEERWKSHVLNIAGNSQAPSPMSPIFDLRNDSRIFRQEDGKKKTYVNPFSFLVGRT